MEQVCIGKWAQEDAVARLAGGGRGMLVLSYEPAMVIPLTTLYATVHATAREETVNVYRRRNRCG